MSFSKDRIRVLLDTTYLLPVVGIEVEGVEKSLIILKNMYRSGKVEIYYTPFNILEIVGKLSRIEYDRDRVRLGLRAIRETFRVTHPTIAGYIRALELRRKGFRDLIDLLLYATAKTRRLIFLTRDCELVNFLKEVGEDTAVVMHEEDFVKKYSEYT